jgi:hypothetical protein
VYEKEANSLTRDILCRNFGGPQFSHWALKELKVLPQSSHHKHIGLVWSLQLLMLKPSLGPTTTAIEHFFPVNVTACIININITI